MNYLSDINYELAPALALSARVDQTCVGSDKTDDAVVAGELPRTYA